MQSLTNHASFGTLNAELLDVELSDELQKARNLLRILATSPDFMAKMQVAFGNSFDLQKVEELAASWVKGDFGSFPPIEMRDAAEINGARGAFAAATNTIYLSREFVRENEGNGSAIASVLLEEYGHYIDSQINAIDSNGDEGEIFADIAQGKVLSESELAALKGEDDTVNITLNKQLIHIEQATVSDSGGFNGSEKTIEFGSKDGKGGGTVQYSYEMFQIPDNLKIIYEGKEIVNTGFVSGSATQRINVPKGNSDLLEVKLTTNDEDTQWNYKIDTTPCPDPIPFEVEAVSGNREEKDGKCVINGTINIGRKGFGQMLKVDGRVEYDDKAISVDGTVTSLIGVGKVTSEPLFQGKFDLDVATGNTTSFTETGKLSNEFKVGGLDIDFSSLTLNQNGIALGAKFELVEELGLPDYTFSGSDALLIDRNNVEFGASIKASIPNFNDIKLFNFLPIKEFSKFSIEYVAPQDQIKIQGKLNVDLSSKPRTGEVIADLSGDNFIQIQGGKADIKGSLSVQTDLKFPPKGWGLKEVRLNIDTLKKDVSGGAKLTLPFGRTINVDGELGFKLPIPPLEPNKLSLNVDNLNLPIPGYPLVFFQGFRGSIENFAKSDPDPIEGSLGASATLGPQILGTSALRFDADGKLSSEKFSGTGTVTIINDKIGKAQGTHTLNWNEKSYETQGNFSILDGAIQTNSGFKVNSGFNINMSGSASVNIPNSIPLIGGAQIGSGNFLLNFSNDGSLSNDFAAGWGTIKVQKLGPEISFVRGFKGFFDGRIETIGAKNVPETNSFIVEPGTQWLVMGADWENPVTNALVQVKAPNGTTFNESDFTANNIAIVDQLTDQNTKSVIVLNPTPGVWDINLANTPGLGNIKYSAFRDSVTPTVEITDPATDVGGGNVAINYNAFDADSNAKVSLFYDTDNQGFDGILIADNLGETDGGGNFIWNTEGVATGDYYVYAMVMDENNAPVFTYSPGRVRVTEAADLSVTKTADADSVIVGNNLTYTIAVTNNGSNNAKGVTLTETLPEGATLVSASINPTQQSGSDLTFDLGDFANGDSKTINITITPPATGTITGTASVTSKTFDPDVANDTAILATTVNAAPVPVVSTDLAVTAIDTPASVNLGDKLTYNFNVSNNSPTKATGVTFTNSLPSGLKDISITSSKGSVSQANGIVNLGELNSGETATVTVNATSIAAHTLIDTASVTSNETDSNLANNAIDNTIIVNPVTPAPADLELSKTVNNTNPNVGDTVTFTLYLANKGAGIASSIKVTDLLPSGLTFVSANSIQGTYDPITGVWDVGNMKDNLTRTLDIVATVNSAGAIPTTAQVTAVSETDPDSTPNNNNPNEDDQASVTLTAIGGSQVGSSTRIVFDEKSYLAQYADVREAYNNGGFEKAFDHCTEYGNIEGRDMTVRLFDETYYLAQNLDVKQAVDEGGYDNAFDHFILWGLNEGRPGSSGDRSLRLLFDENYYLGQNTDVKAAVDAGDLYSGLIHFFEYGQFEGRQTSPLANNLIPI